MMIRLAQIMFVALCCSSCLSFKGISIDPNVSTFYIDNILQTANNAPADLARRFQDELKLKINNNTRLLFNDTEPDIEFAGSLSKWTVAPAAPQAGQDVPSTAFNRLTITVQISYLSNVDEEDEWKQNFSHFVDFANDVDLLAVQEDLIDEIFDQITEDIFNKAFTNW